MKQVFSQCESNLVKYPTDISSDTSLSLSEFLSFPSTPSTTFPNHLYDRYRELNGTSTLSRLDWNSFVAPLLFLANTSIAIDSTIGHLADYDVDTNFIRIFKNINYKSFPNLN